MIKETITRIKSKTPRYFKTLRNACIAVSSVSALVTSVEDKLPEFVQKSIPTLITVGLVGTFFSSLPKEEN